MPRSLRRFFIRDDVRSPSSPRSVMALIRDPSTWPGWQEEIVSIDGPSPLRAGDDANGVARMMGFRVHGRTSTVVSTDDVFEEDVIVGVRMRITYRVVDDDGGCRIVRELDAELPGGFLGAPIGWMLRRRLRLMQKKVLAALAGQASSGA